MAHHVEQHAYQITCNVEPLPAKREVDREEKAVERLRNEYQANGRHSLLVAVGKKERKIESLSTGFIRPFTTTFMIRVWDENEVALSAKCAAIKNAINNLGGAQYYECALPSTAKKLFFSSWPGWTHSGYQHRSLYAEDTFLADTINYFDTGGMPLAQLQVATAVALLSRMIGEAHDAETQQVRQAILARYIHQLYDDTFEEWSKRNREKLPRVQRLACAAHHWKQQRMPAGTTEIEAYAELRDLMAGQDAQALEFCAAISEKQITAFLKNPQTERTVMQTAHAEYGPDDYPVHASLVELMQFARFEEHKKDEVDHLATLLSAWTAHGQYGRLFDGRTNVSLTGKIAHFELGYIPEQANDLKTAAGLLIAGFTRQHIISLPRARWKRILYEELARFLDVPGGEKIVAESYAQLRKFNCWTASIVQQYSKFKDTRIRPAVIGNSKQFFLMRQFDRSDIDAIALDIGLPESIGAAIQNYPMPEQQPDGKKFSSLCFYSPVIDPPLCGTVRNVQPKKEAVHEKAAV